MARHSTAGVPAIDFPTQSPHVTPFKPSEWSRARRRSIRETAHMGRRGSTRSALDDSHAMDVFHARCRWTSRKCVRTHILHTVRAIERSVNFLQLRALDAPRRLGYLRFCSMMSPFGIADPGYWTPAGREGLFSVRSGNILSPDAQPAPSRLNWEKY